MKKSKLLICALFVSLLVSALPGTKGFAAGDTGENAAASGLQDENEQRLEEITAMDKDGDIYEIGESDGSLDEAVEVDDSGDIIGEDSEDPSDENAENGIATLSVEPEDRSASVLVVNFNTGSGGLTYYSGNGYTSGSYGADAAYLGTDKNGDIKFMLAGVKATVDKDDVELVKYSDVANNVSYYKVSGGKLYHYISQNLNNKPASTINNGPAPSYLSEGVKYYSYDGHYFYDDYSTMSADYQNGSNGASAVNSGNAFYNYFQFLDMNQSTAYSAEELESILNKAMQNAGKNPSSSKLNGTAAVFVKYQNKYSVNALLSLGIAINESGWGTSSIAKNKNNLFGLNAVDSSPGQSANYFASVDDCIREFMSKWMAGGYLDDSDWRNNGEYLGNKAEGINVKYASDPYWGEKAAAHAWNLDTLGGNRDYLGLGSSEDDQESDETNTGDTPAEDDKTPVEEDKTPAEEDKTPAEDDKAPAEEDKTPAEDDKAPAEEDKTPAEDDKAPAEEDKTPAEDDKTSAEDDKTPAEDDKTSAEEDKTPAQDNETAKDEAEKLPENESAVPPSSDTVVKPTVTVPADGSSAEETTGTANGSAAENTDKKDDVQQESDEKILTDHESGISVKGNVSGKLTAASVEPNTDKYTEYVSADPVKDKIILGVYEITLDGSLEGKVQLTFTVGTEYNGRDVIILHYADDGSYEKYAGTVKNGQVTISVDSFSPFVIALGDTGSSGDGSVPQTGVTADPGSLAVIMIFAAAFGVTALLKRRSRVR